MYIANLELMMVGDVCQIAENLEKLSPCGFEYVASKLQEEVVEKQTQNDTKEPLTLLCD